MSGTEHFLQIRMSAKQWLRSACANAQADQCHCFAPCEQANIQHFFSWMTAVLFRMRGRTDCSVHMQSASNAGQTENTRFSISVVSSWYIRRAKSQIRLRIEVFWSGPLFLCCPAFESVIYTVEFNKKKKKKKKNKKKKNGRDETAHAQYDAKYDLSSFRSCSKTFFRLKDLIWQMLAALKHLASLFFYSYHFILT